MVAFKHPTVRLQRDRKRQRAEAADGEEHGGGRVIEDVTLAEWAEEWWPIASGHLSARTQIDYQRHLQVRILPALGEMRLVDLNSGAVARWVDATLAGGCTPVQLAKAMRVLSQCMRRATQRGLTPYGDPVAGVTPPARPRRRRPRPLSVEQIEALRLFFLERVNDWNRPRAALRSATIVSVLAYGGLRPSEAFGAKIGDVDLDARGIWVRDVYAAAHREEDSKTGWPRFAPLPDEAVSDLEIWLTVSSGGRRDWLLPSQLGKVGASTYNSWAWTLREVSAIMAERYPEWAHEFSALRPYALRHSCASNRIRGGDPIVEIAEDLGHSPATLLASYAHVVRAARRHRPASIAEQIRHARGVYDTHTPSLALRDHLLGPAPTTTPKPRPRRSRRTLQLVENRYVWTQEEPAQRRRRHAAGTPSRGG
ncbi:MAG: site-specific integrase [Conexibacter sp.]|nr:site-specific integrase [Conexibacter sp.]